MKQKKTNHSQNYEEAFKQLMKTHKQKTQKAGFPIIEEKQLDKHDRTQQFYKTFQRQFRNSIMMKHGYKIASLQLQQQDLALYCFSLLQAQANFPVKIYTIDYKSKQPIQDPQKIISRKDLWMQTHIMCSSLISSNRDELLFEAKIYKFFNDYLLKQLREFMKNRINWDYMISKDYTDEKVILEFQKTVIIPANQKFSTIFK